MTVAIATLALCGLAALLASIPSAPRPEDVNPSVYRMLEGGYFHPDPFAASWASSSPRSTCSPELLGTRTA